MYMKSELICLQIKKQSITLNLGVNLIVLFYTPVRVREVLGDGSPSEITLYIQE